MAQKNWGFDTSAMDRKVRPQDDYYEYANGTWIKTATIPKEEARWGSFNILRRMTEDQLRTIVNDASKKRHPRGTEAQLVADMYRAGMDEKRRNALKTAPLKPYLAIIDGITDRASLAKALGKLQLYGVSVPWGYGVDQDSKQSTKYVLHFFQSGLGMPDREYYLEDGAEFVRVKSAYLPYLTKMHGFLGLDKKASTRAAETVIRIETELAQISMKKEDARDAEKTYHKLSWSALRALAAPFDIEAFARASKVPRVPYVIVTQPEFVKGAAKLFMALPIEDIKTYLRAHLIIDAAPYLSSDIVKTNFSFYGTVLYGQKAMKPLWRRALGSVNGVAGFALGKLYVEKHFTKEAARKMNELVDDLFAAYESRMKTLDWMSPKTRAFAVKKLRAVARKVGYPTKWRSYKGLEVRADDYFGNIVRAGAFAHAREMRKLKKPIDRTEWFMTPQTVNAYCSFTMNEIVFPAAILQHPFFDATSDMGVNYGAIGSVIGHELTHAFDDQGSKFDAKGNMKSWWTAEDRKRFEKKAKLLVDQFNAFTVDDGVHVNGQLTLGENIADLGGAVIAYDAYQRHLKKHGRKDIDGFSPEERFFLGFAQQEQELKRPEFAKTAVLTDPHSPAEFRINGPLAHVQGFYDTYKLTKKDKLYRDPKNRAQIW